MLTFQLSLVFWEVQTPAGEKDFDEVGGSIKNVV